MALTKTPVDLIGTSASKTNIGGGASSTSSHRDVSGKIGLSAQVVVVYGASIPASDPLVEIFASNDGGTSVDTEAYEAVYVPRQANTTKQVTIPISFAESIKGLKAKVTNGATNAIDAWVSLTEAAL